MMRKIESLRIDKGVTAEEMAKDFGVTVKTIYNWQDNQRALTGEKIIKICKINFSLLHNHSSSSNSVIKINYNNHK